ncbi:MAG: hypothetical protein MJZ21_04225, partial [archaeon]|nr:hypothetical protein [archaeon]
MHPRGETGGAELSLLKHIDKVVAATMIICAIAKIVFIINGKLLGAKAVCSYAGACVLLVGAAVVLLRRNNDLHNSAVHLGYAIFLSLICDCFFAIYVMIFDLSIVKVFVALYMLFCTYLLDRGFKYNTHRITVLIAVYCGITIFSYYLIYVNNIPLAIILEEIPMGPYILVMLGAYAVMLNSKYLVIQSPSTRIRYNAEKMLPSLITMPGTAIGRCDVPVFSGDGSGEWVPSCNPVVEREARIRIRRSRNQCIRVIRMN